MADEDKTLSIRPGQADPSSGASEPGPGTALPKAIGDFRVLERIGAGAMGEVYLGTHRESGLEAAIKVVSPRLTMEEGFLKRFEREIASLLKLDHANIAKAVGHGMHNGQPWLAMEFVRGPNLADVQRKQGAMNEDAVLRLAMQVARGLDYVHATAGLIHRDIKPANILIAGSEKGESGHVAKIIDFGLAKIVGQAEQAGLTMTGMVMGTPFYMSPEQIRGEKGVDLRTDIYALGATMYHLLTNHLPFEGTSPGMVMTAHLTQKVPDPGEKVPSLHKATRKLVMTAMAKNCDERFLNYQGFIAACEKALSDIHERDHGTMRLLRKPLVLPGLQTRPPSLPKLDDPADDPFAGPVTTSAHRKQGGEQITTSRRASNDQVAKTAGRSAPSPGRREKTTAGPTARPHSSASSSVATEVIQPATLALRKVQTDRMRKLQTERAAISVGTSGFTPPKVGKAKSESAVYHRERIGPPTIWPLALLLAAMVALVVFLAVR